MSLYQFMCCAEGYRRSQGEEDKIEPPTADEFFDLVERYG